MRLIYELEFEAIDTNDAALKLNVADASELKVIAHIDDAGTRHECAPPPEGFTLVRSDRTRERDATYFAIAPTNKGEKLDAYEKKLVKELALPPTGAKVWKNGQWQTAYTVQDAEKPTFECGDSLPRTDPNRP